MSILVTAANSSKIDSNSTKKELAGPVTPVMLLPAAGNNDYLRHL